MDAITLWVERKAGEWMIRVYVNGTYREGSYCTAFEQDAIDTARNMARHYCKLGHSVMLHLSERHIEGGPGFTTLFNYDRFDPK